LASAALWSADIGVFLRDFVEVVAAISPASQRCPYRANYLPATDTEMGDRAG
jgi:hypothetical protein